MVYQPMPPSAQARVFISHARKEGAVLARRLQKDHRNKASTPGSTPCASPTSHLACSRQLSTQRQISVLLVIRPGSADPTSRMRRSEPLARNEMQYSVDSSLG